MVYAFEKRLWDITVLLELFLEVYGAFAQEEVPTEEELRGILNSYANDYCQDMIEYRTRECVDPELDFAAKIIMNSDFSDLRYLYLFGECITENELGVAAFLNGLSQEEIDSCARTYTEGYRLGFVNGHKDLSKKKTVNIRYNLGFERMVKAAVLQFEEMGLKPVIYRYPTHAVNRRGSLELAIQALLQTRSLTMIIDRTGHFFWIRILCRSAFVPCRLPMRNIRSWRMFTLVRPALRYLEKLRFHR